jgi:mRNA interferase RelE/StbE
MRRLPRDVLDRLAKAFQALEEDPYIGKRLVDLSLYSYRVGDLRIVYSLKEDNLIVLVIDIGPRGDIYRRLRQL